MESFILPCLTQALTNPDVIDKSLNALACLFELALLDDRTWVERVCVLDGNFGNRFTDLRQRPPKETRCTHPWGVVLRARARTVVHQKRRRKTNKMQRPKKRRSKTNKKQRKFESFRGPNISQPRTRPCSRP